MKLGALRLLALVRAALAVALATLCSGTLTSLAAERPPNVVLILTDNHSAWTLGCYGNRDIRTPNIDRLAREGLLFGRCYSSNAVCSPTRATLLTGLIPSQHGVHSYLTAGGAQIGRGAYNTIAEFNSLPEILTEAGYSCGLIGKWHLGDNSRPQDGFTYWVTMPHGHTRTFYNAEVIENGKVRQEPQYLTKFWTDHAEAFIRQNKNNPFFLLLAYNGPYGLGESMLNPASNSHADYYADKMLKTFPREKMHPWLAGNKKLLNNVNAMRRYAAEISGIDDGVGRILAALKDHGIDDDTLLVFTADQGLATGQNGLWAMGDHTRPLTAYDPMLHVPLIYRHPKHIPANQRADILVSNYDFLPTLLDYLELGEKMPRNPPSPGRSFVHMLHGEEMDWHNVVFFEFENTRAIRTDAWKLITRFHNGPDELYDLENDPEERLNLINDPGHTAQQEDLRSRLETFFSSYADPKYDLSRGGKSKARRRTEAMRTSAPYPNVRP
jgi:arylsulfatase A-like enzyme